MELQDAAVVQRAGEAEVGCTDAKRFELELEFLQCLANPGYLNWLAQNRYLDDSSFVAYLRYLQYWQRPQYARFVIYPHSLYFLDLLQTPEFRGKLASQPYKELLHAQQFFFWQHACANRMRDKAEAAAAAEAVEALAAAPGADGGAGLQPQQPQPAG